MTIAKDVAEFVAATWPPEEVDTLRADLARVEGERDEARTAACRMLELGWTLHEETRHWLDGPADTNGDALLRTAMAAWGDETAIFNLGDIAARANAADLARVEGERRDAVETLASVRSGVERDVGLLRADRDALAASLASLHDEAEYVCERLMSGDTACVGDAIHGCDALRAALAATADPTHGRRVIEEAEERGARWMGRHLADRPTHRVLYEAAAPEVCRAAREKR